MAASRRFTALRMDKMGIRAILEQAAGVPVVLGYIDYGTREVCIDRIFQPTGDIDTDMMAIKRYYQGRTGRHPEQFDTGL